MLHEKASGSTFTETCYGEQITIVFDVSAGDLEKSVQRLIHARKPPTHPCTTAFSCCCGVNAGKFNRLVELSKIYKYLSICPKQYDQDAFKQSECVFSDCNTSLPVVVSTDVNVYTCSECSMFVCHSCKRDHLAEVSVKRRRRRR